MFHDVPMPRKFPKLRLAWAENAVQRMHRHAEEFALYGVPLDKPVFEELVKGTAAALGPSFHTSYPVVFSSLSDLAGQTPDREQLDRAFRRLACNPDMLEAGVPVMPWMGHVEERTWTAVQFRDMRIVNGAVGFKLRVIWGPMTGTWLYKNGNLNDPGWGRMLWILKLRQKGRDLQPLVGIRMWAELRYRLEELTFARYAVDNQLARLNSLLLRGRKNKCPRRYTWPCVRCPVGLDQCQWACRETTIEALVPKETDQHVAANSHSEDRSPAGNAGRDGVG